ncbi:response regulator [Myxococcota bacterium]|nr:response regulator [Myxococcota bacterium]
MASELILVIDDSPTIIKVVELVLTKAGFKVQTTQDGETGIALAKQIKPNLILLDFVMPKMNGYQVCKELSQDEELKSIPVVLMSAKGEQVGERFVKVMGIVDYITKPFSPEAITAVVTHALEKFQDNEDPTAVPVAKPSVQQPQDLQEDADREQQAWKEAMSKLRGSISRAVASTLISAPELSGVVSDTQFLVENIKNTLTNSFLEGCIGELRTTVPDLMSGEVSLSGTLSVIPTGEVLTILASQRQSGILTMSKSAAKVDVYFKGGQVVMAAAAGISDEYLLGRYVIELELMTKDELDDFIAGLPPRSHLLGLQLVKSGRLTLEQVKTAMAKQTREICYELLNWRTGKFTFVSTRDLPAIAEEAGLDLSVDAILLEGFRRVDDWHLIEQEIDDFEIVLLRNDDAINLVGRNRLVREELTVLELVNGRNTIRDIIRQSRMSSFDVTKLLYRLLSAKLIRKKVSPVAV